MAPLVPGAASPDEPFDSLAAGGDERELVAAVLRHDRKAAAQFVASHIDAVYTYVRHRLTPRADLVDDVVQDVFLAGLKGLAAFQGHSSLRTWLIGIARHKIDDVFRGLVRVADVIDDDVDPAVRDELLDVKTPDEQIDTARQREKARRVLSEMPDRYALVLLWRYWEEKSTRDIAGAIKTTEKSVERLLARARARFKELWVKE